MEGNFKSRLDNINAKVERMVDRSKGNDPTRPRGGRGSGANSMIAYLLRITDVDPTELDLYFERFINENRSNPPDFDIDFSWTDRDDMTRYIFETFGPERTALLATYSTFKNDAVIRELGKVFGLPPNEIEHLQYLKERKLHP